MFEAYNMIAENTISGVELLVIVNSFTLGVIEVVKCLMLIT